MSAATPGEKGRFEDVFEAAAGCTFLSKSDGVEGNPAMLEKPIKVKGDAVCEMTGYCKLHGHHCSYRTLNKNFFNKGGDKFCQRQFCLVIQSTLQMQENQILITR